MRPTRPRLIVLGLVLGLVAAACGSDSSTTDDSDAVTTTSATSQASTTSTANTGSAANTRSYALVDSGQVTCYDTTAIIDCPAEGEAFFGQDAEYLGNSPSYTNNGDGTITDNVTGLMWQQDPGDRMEYADAAEGLDSFSLAGYDDWRLPTVKELYSLYLGYGTDPLGPDIDETALTPFIDDDHFVFAYGDTSSGFGRLIDSQWATSSIYESTVMGDQECFFGVNFADGRIKCYPTMPGPSQYFTIYVRGSSDYGVNAFSDGGDGTIVDAATGLTWQQHDNGEGVDWETALSYCSTLDLGGSTDWRLPNVKELQSIVDYSRSPDTTDSPAIDALFDTTSITNEAGEADYPFFWSSTTHVGYPTNLTTADYVAFGRALGDLGDGWIDVHGAGAQRSDPKAGDPAAVYDDFGEAQGTMVLDAMRIENYVRCVQG
ncbi:MAG: DUF1566 domain-containing protein [Actinomycetia bacterium]|nr:DUF1566 domain-containing protein [Actinomycetes bacterium]MCP4957770.1 DUF1566 domain-containing protein [Actinomycetes bacterium]